MAVTSAGEGSAERVEICDEDGFLFKRRRHAGDKASVASDVAVVAPEPVEDGAAEMKRLRRQQRLSYLKSLQEKYKKEMDKWERLSLTLDQLSQQVPERPSVDLRSINVAGFQSLSLLEDRGHGQSVDELLVQVECQQAILRRIEEICSEVDALREEKEERMANLLIELPIWSSPRTLLKSLSD